jgi:hypothetical protein
MKHLAYILLLTMTACGPVATDDDDDVQEVVDKDGDGFSFEEDCNDSNPDIYPGAPESCEEPLFDANCDGAIGGLDEDEDGFRACDDCDDKDASIYPNADEICDGVDNDCDTQIDDADPDVDLSTAQTFYVDEDGDSFGDDEQPVIACDAPPDTAEKDGDCNDKDAEIHPDADEICDYIDNNCDGLADRDDSDVIITDEEPICYSDTDKDGFGDEFSDGLQTCFCYDTEAENNDDCNDDDAYMHPDMDFSDAPSASGSWDLKCDGVDERQYPDAGAYCTLLADGRTCDFVEGYVYGKPAKCGNGDTYLSKCKAAKSSTGVYCEKTEEYRIQNCR